MCRDSSHYSWRSQDVLCMMAPGANTELGLKKKKALRYAAPWSWNDLEKDVQENTWTEHFEGISV